MSRRIMFLSICGLLLSGSTAWGVPILLSTQEIQEANPSQESSGEYNIDWSYVYNYKGCSGVAIDDYWILTAHHVADDPGNGNLTISGEVYSAVETIYNNNADLALVRYDKALPSHYEYATTASFVGTEVIMIGYGNYGEVTQRAKSGYWNEPGTEYPDVKRWGTNIIDALVPIKDLFGDTYLTLKSTISGKKPAENSTSYETGLNIGDSGGGVFAKIGGEWVLIGIHSARGGSPYDSTYSVPVGNYDEWIASYAYAHAPEPTSVLMLGIPVIMMVLRRKTR